MNRVVSGAVFGGAAAVVVALAAVVCWAGARAGGAEIGVPQAHRASEVPLVSTDGQQVRLADGPRIVVFGYVGCAERCPLTLEALSRAAEARPGRFARITFVDCDPWTDSRGVVRRYVRHFPGVQGVTGDARALAANEVALGMWPISRREDVAAHDTRIFVVDGRGVLIAALAPEQSSDALASSVETALATTPAPAPGAARTGSEGSGAQPRSRRRSSKSTRASTIR